jgi:hypothetical protein
MDDERIQKQYFVDDNPLKRIEQVDATMIGRQAQVPIWSDLNSGGYTSTSAAGGVLNTATNQPTNQALYTLTQHFFPIAWSSRRSTRRRQQHPVGHPAKNLEIRARSRRCATRRPGSS